MILQPHPLVDARHELIRDKIEPVFVGERPNPRLPCLVRRLRQFHHKCDLLVGVPLRQLILGLEIKNIYIYIYLMNISENKISMKFKLINCIVYLRKQNRRRSSCFGSQVL